VIGFRNNRYVQAGFRKWPFSRTGFPRQYFENRTLKSGIAETSSFSRTGIAF